MADIKQEYLLSLYVVESIINNSGNSEIAIVKHSITEKVYIRKKIKGYELNSIYADLKNNPHKNIAEIEEVISFDDYIYVIQECVSGLTISQLLEQEGTFDKKKATGIMEQVCDALKHIHSLNPPIIHRDIKPSNVIIDKHGIAKLIDFDAARYYKPDVQKDTQYLGTEGYAPPEQFGYAQTDTRSDIYSAGRLLGEMLTGMVGINKKIQDKHLASVVSKSTKFDPNERYQSAEELKKDLHQSPLRMVKVSVFVGIILIFAVISISSLLTNKDSDGGESDKMEEVNDSTELLSETTVGEVDSTESLTEATTEEVVKEGFSIDLKSFYEEDKYAQDLFEEKDINRKMKDTLKNEFDYFNECLYRTDNTHYYEDTDSYYLSGGVPGLYTIMEACLVIYQSGEIEGAYLYQDEIFYFSSMEEEPVKIHSGIFSWMSDKTSNSLHMDEDNIEMVGTYINPENNNYIKIKKDETGYFMDLFGSYGVNIGAVEEYIDQYDVNNWAYFVDGEIGIRLMFTKDSVLVFEYGTFGGMGVILSGQYFRH